MMTNPLSRNAEPIGYTTSLRAWCEEQNRKPIMARMGRWYHVAENDGREMVDCLSGVDGENVHRLMEDRLPEFQGWSKARMDGYRRWLSDVAQRGLTVPLRNAA